MQRALGQLAGVNCRERQFPLRCAMTTKAGRILIVEDESLVAPFVEFGFMRRALAGCLALSVSAPPIGVFLTLRRMSLMSDAMSHAILPGGAAVGAQRGAAAVEAAGRWGRRHYPFGIICLVIPGYVCLGWGTTAVTPAPDIKAIAMRRSSTSRRRST